MMKPPRPDMSDWVLHFVHDRNSEFEITAQDLFGPDAPPIMPAHTESDIDRRFHDYHYAQLEHEDLEADASAMCVLTKILDQGMIRSGWSFRSRKATIYGPKSAVCFTEMPLSSLVEYANTRGDSGKVAAYAIGLLKEELFAAGGRPVIYGLSGDHREVGDNRWPRFLAPECGIGEQEQYRYVALSLEGNRRIDWTHEREWRWADHRNCIEVPGLPVWRKNDDIKFSRAFILVRTEEEAQLVLSQLRRQCDAGNTNWDEPYDLELIKATRVVSLEQLTKAALLGSNEILTIEQIPHHLVTLVPSVPATDAAKVFAAAVISEALDASAAAAVEWRKGGDRDVAGFAEVVIEDGLSDFTRAGLELGLLKPLAGIHPFGSGGYWVDGVSRCCETQSIAEHEAAAKAAQKIIAKHLPELPSRIWTRWD